MPVVKGTLPDGPFAKGGSLILPVPKRGASLPKNSTRQPDPMQGAAEAYEQQALKLATDSTTQPDPMQPAVDAAAAENLRLGNLARKAAGLPTFPGDLGTPSEEPISAGKSDKS